MRKTYGPGYPRTLGALMAWSGLGPEAPAVTDAAGTLNRCAFQNRVLGLAAGLRRGGVGSGSRVALWLPNGIGYLAAIFACARLGAFVIHINTRFRMAEVGNLLRRSRAVALVTEWGFPPVDFPAIFAALPAEDRAALRCVLGLQLPPGVTQLVGLPVLPLDGAAADAGPDEATGERPCLTFTTSGTTGGPKLVLHDQQAIAGHAADVSRHIGLDAPDAVLLAAVPWPRSPAARMSCASHSSTLAESGKYASTQVFRAEEAVGLAMMRGLSPEQQAKATIGTLLPGEVLTAAYNDNVRMPYEGIRYDDLSSKQQDVLRDLIGVNLHRLRPGHAEIRLEEAFDHLRDTHFSWIGAHDDRGPFYYRIYSPVVLIEFDHQPGIVYANDEPTRDHIHTVVRTPNGNDTARTCCASITRGTIIPTRGARTASAKSNVNRPASLASLIFFRFNTKYAPRLSPSPIRLSASRQRDRRLSSRWQQTLQTATLR